MAKADPTQPDPTDPVRQPAPTGSKPATAVRTHGCGMRTVWVDAAEPHVLVAAVADLLPAGEVGLIVCFFSPELTPERLAAAFAIGLPGVPVVGCTTSGAISPVGAADQGLLAIAFPRAGFRTATLLVSDIHHLDVEAVAETVRGLRMDFETATDAQALPHRFALTLIDGLSNVEETVVSTLAWALNDIPIVGGSAGDDLRFDDTALIFEGRVIRHAAILVLVATRFPTKLFKTDNFEPTTKKFVVTSVDEEQRTVHEFNAEPAAREYAVAVGLDPGSLTPMSFAAHPLVVKVGGEFFCRSIRRMNGDGSLSFFCAVSEGVVMTLAQPCDIVATTRAELRRVEAELGGVDLVIGFECVLRRLDSEARQVKREMAELYKGFNVVGFETYGEQYRSMHLNQTFTGIAIGCETPT